MKCREVAALVLLIVAAISGAAGDAIRHGKQRLPIHATFSPYKTGRPQHAREGIKASQASMRQRNDDDKHIRTVFSNPAHIYKTIDMDPEFAIITQKYMSAKDAQTAALTFAHAEHHLTRSDYHIEHAYQDDDDDDGPRSTHVYLRQMVHGIRVEAATMNIHVDANRQIIAYSSSFHTGPKPAKPPAWSPDDPAMQRSMLDALRLLAVHIGRRISKHDAIQVVPQRGQSENDVKYRVARVPFATEPIAVRRMFIHTKGSRLDLAWEFTVKLAVDHICAHVSVDRPRVLALFNWADRYTYKAIPVTDRNILTSRVRLIKDPEKAFAPDYDWHTVEGIRYSTLSGNNAFIADWRGHTAIEGSNGQFIFPLNSPDNYAKGAAVNAFYVVNAMHDLFSKYGFTEKNGNFQRNNMRPGGADGDPVEIYLQNPFALNNAIFVTPPDGHNGVLVVGMYAEDDTTLDLAWSNEVLIHELTHGLSSRLVGSPYNANVFSSPESSGLAEGWSDFVAVWMHMNKQTDPMAATPFSNYFANDLRVYPLSVNRDINPMLYGDLCMIVYDPEHTIGILWSSMLYEVYWTLVRRLGFTRRKSVPSKRYGNTLTLRLMVYALRLTPEFPTFLSARKAFLQAERALTRGRYHCDIWRAFASRGLGYSAQPYVEGESNQDLDAFDVPRECTSALVH